MKTGFNVFILMAVILCFGGCKKGEGDPAVSLRTRKARLEGEWRLVDGSASLTTDGYNENYAIKNNKVTIITTLYIYQPIGYTLNLKISKDGTFSFREIIGGVMIDASGTWNFNAGVGEAKNKEAATFTINKVNKGYTHDTHLFNRISAQFVYKIRTLKNKELVINSTGKIYSASKGKYVTFSTDYSFIQ